MYYICKFKWVVMLLVFWWLLVCGSVLLLVYFIVGKNDLVGIFFNFFLVFVLIYNLVVYMCEVKCC